MTDEQADTDDGVDPGVPGRAPDTDVDTTPGRRHTRRTAARRRAPEDTLVRSWGLTWRAATLRIADALAERIATPSPPDRPHRPRTSRRWAIGGGAAAAAVAYARSRGWV